MVKKLELIIKHTCDNCPYFGVMPGGDYNDGYLYCAHPKHEETEKWGTKVIAEDVAIGEYQHDYIEYLESIKTLFPLDISTVPDNPANIPRWCPLPNIES